MYVANKCYETQWPLVGIVFLCNIHYLASLAC